MVTPIEIVDTTIKIGLGALITGFIGYQLAKLNHNREAEKARSQRKRDLLETIAEHIESVHQTAIKHWAFIINWIRFTPAGELTEAAQADFAKTQTELSDSFKGLLNAEAKLLLLGEVEGQKLLRDYGEQVIIYREEALIKRTVTVEKLMEYKENLFKSVKRFLLNLAVYTDSFPNRLDD